MANGRPGDSHLHDIVDLRIETYGPSCDALIREIVPRLPRSHAAEFAGIVESWPWEQDGSGPRDTDRLFDLLLDWRARVDRLRPDPPEPMPEASLAPPRSVARRAASALAGFLIGGIVCALGAAILAGMLTSIPSGDAAMGTAIGIVFVIMPIAFLAGGVAGAVLAARR